MAIPKKRLERALNNSIKDGASYATMEGITSTYSTPFALSLGASNAEIGILNSAPSLLMTITQFLTGRYIDRIGRKRVATSLVLLQKFVLIPIMLIPIFFQQSGLWLFIVLFSISGTAISIAGTAWSCLIGSIVPEKSRGSYFGKRIMIQSAFSFFATLAAGYILGLFNSPFGFSVIFFLAFVSGLVSYFYVRTIPDIKEKEVTNDGRNKMSMVGFLKEVKKYRNFFPFTVHMSFVHFAVSIASPFFTVYMLTVMKISYEWYAIIVAAEILTRILMMRYWGKLSDEYGDRNIMVVCNIMIVFYPFFFLFSRNPIDLVLIGIFSGFAWSGFDLTTFNYLLDVTPPDKRPSYISRYKVLIGIAFFLGPLAGGFLSQYFSTASILSLDGLQTIFLLSFILRFVAAAFSLPRLKEVRSRRTMPVTDVFIKAFATYPIKGITHELVYLGHSFQHFEKRVGKRLKGTLKEIV